MSKAPIWMPLKRPHAEVPAVIRGLLDRRAYSHEVRGIELQEEPGEAIVTYPLA